MSDKVLKNCNVWGEICDIEICDKSISFIGKSDKSGEDMEGKYVYPGLFDIHCHGLIGHDTMDCGELTEMSEYLAKKGITSWYPTTMTMDFETIEKAVNESKSENGAKVLGFHIEGPYISPKYKGAQNEKFIKNPDCKEFSKLKYAKIVTIAPELENCEEFIKGCNCVTSLGHSAAGYDETIKAIEAGAKCLTHTFNAMTPLHHREPGLIGAAADKNIYVQVICDGIHIHPAMIRLLYKLFGKERMVLISDAMRATHLKDGEYMFGGQPITVSEGVARTHDGAIAGSTSLLIDCVKKAVEFGIPREDAFYMASTTPAELMNEKIGKIEVGYPADLIVTDENMNVVKTFVEGKEF